VEMPGVSPVPKKQINNVYKRSQSILFHFSLIRLTGKEKLRRISLDFIGTSNQ